MRGQTPKLTPLAARKQLLVLESDLNRAQLIEAAQDWKDELHRSKEHLMRIGSIATTTAKLAATISTVRSLFSRPKGEGKRSWLTLLVEGFTTGTSLWNMMRSQRRKD